MTTEIPEETYRGSTCGHVYAYVPVGFSQSLARRIVESKSFYPFPSLSHSMPFLFFLLFRVVAYTRDTSAASGRVRDVTYASYIQRCPYGPVSAKSTVEAIGDGSIVGI